jgi:hypothetical protein
VLIRLSGKGLQPARERDCHWATLLETSEQLGSTSNNASTKLLRLDMTNVSICRPQLAVSSIRTNETSSSALIMLTTGLCLVYC